jgi:hypothetical protein
MLAGDTALRLAEDVAFQSIGGDDEDTVVLSLKSGYLYTCNGVAASFLSALNGGKTFAGLVDGLFDEYDVPRETLEADMSAFAEKLIKEQLIIVAPAGQ